MTTARVLFVDDDRASLDANAAALERASDELTVETALGSEAALDRLAAVDAVVSDYRMRDRDGLELLDAVRETRPDLPFVLFTGKGSEEIASEAIAAGVTDYVTKGGVEQFEVLAHRLTNAIDGHRAERQAAAASERIDAMFERMTDGVVSLDENWHCTYANDHAAALLGLDVDDLVGHHLWSVLPDDDQIAALGERLTAAMAAGEQTEFEYHYEPSDRWFRLRVYPAADGLSLYFADVTDRKSRERTIRESERRWEAVFEGSRDAMVVTDGDGRYERVNSAACSLFDLPEDELVGARTADFVDPGFDVGNGWNPGYDDANRGIFRLVTPDGRVRITEYTESKVLDDRHLLVFRDVTQRTLRRQRVQVLQRVLRHNLRNELNVALGEADVLLEQTDDESVRERMAVVREAIDRLVDLGEKVRVVDQTLDRDVTDSSIDLTELVGELVDEVRTTYPSVRFETDLCEPVTVVADGRLDLALEELIQNAIEHNDTDAPTVSVSTTSGDEWVELVVADDGPGIPETEQTVLTRGGESALQHGSGFGLWLVYWVVTRSGGTLRFEDNDPRGSRVTVRLHRD